MRNHTVSFGSPMTTGTGSSSVCSPAFWLHKSAARRLGSAGIDLSLSPALKCNEPITVCAAARCILLTDVHEEILILLQFYWDFVLIKANAILYPLQLKLKVYTSISLPLLKLICTQMTKIVSLTWLQGKIKDWLTVHEDFYYITQFITSLTLCDKTFILFGGLLDNIICKHKQILAW